MTPEQIKDSIIAVQEGLNPTFKVLETWIGSGKITIDRVFEIGIRHNYAVAIADIITCLLFLIVIIIGYFSFKKLYKFVEQESFERGWMYVPFFIIFSAFIIIIFTVFYSDIIRIVAPEWSTIDDFIKMLKNK